MNQSKRYLALGDSYTIGEGVAPESNFPSQLVQLLAEHEVQFEKPEIIAVTGWTTDELNAGIDERQPKGPYDLVTLLIGVNNQYRNRTVADYKPEFEALLDRVIGFAGGDYRKVVVLSIPDWGHTPFAQEKGVDAAAVAQEIAAYNEAKQEITLSKGVKFLDITPLTKQLAASDIEKYLVEDKLHYSAAIYEEWAMCLLPLAMRLVNF
jgi:lysophospholipase L1-like esterase